MGAQQTYEWLRSSWALAAVTVVLAASCSAGGDDADNQPDGPTSPDSGEGLAEIGASLVDVDPIDRRATLLGELGAPDAFVITVDEIDGTVSRFESWSYFDALTQIDMVDGELLWDIEIPAMPDGSLLPLGYDPLEFTMLSSLDDTIAKLGDVELQQVATAVDFEVDGAEMWAGEQLAMAFVDDQLIYVETFPLAPGEQEIVE